jgi:glycosyltransferase involved in cell wall biosynthesis
LADKFIVAYSGNLGRVHDFSTIIEAAEELKSHPEIVFLFIGRGAQFDQVRATAKQLDLTSIRFLPPASREALPAALAAADAHLVTLKPAFADLVFPSKLAGVLAAGRPVLFVGPPEGDIARLLVSEDCGMTVAPGNGRRLAEVILEWQSAPVRRHELGQHARGAYEKHFSLARALTQWEEILHRTTAAANNASQ